MKMITTIVKPFKLDDVKEALKAAGASGIKGAGTWGQRTETTLKA